MERSGLGPTGLQRCLVDTCTAAKLAAGKIKKGTAVDPECIGGFLHECIKRKGWLIMILYDNIKMLTDSFSREVVCKEYICDKSQSTSASNKRHRII